MKMSKHNNGAAKTLDLRRPTSRPASNRISAVKIGLIGIPSLLIIVALSIFVTLQVVRPKSSTGKTGMERAVASVGHLMLLPSGETPTYGTVADITKLKDQTFFANAKNGDQVLIYQKAKLSILYRPSINKIVNVGPLVIGNQGSPYVTSRIAIENGTDNDPLLDKMTQSVTQDYPNATIVYKGKASRTYPTSLVIDESKKNQPLAEQIADSLSLHGGQQPLGEAEPAADIWIIIGQDYH